jgi:hypothetical protein
MVVTKAVHDCDEAVHGCDEFMRRRRRFVVNGRVEDEECRVGRIFVTFYDAATGWWVQLMMQFLNE